MKKEISYEAAYQELALIVRELENDTISVDKLMEKVKRARELVKICREKLLVTEQELNETLNN
jgi:exodeoxyribonuclease VII small subunit